MSESEEARRAEITRRVNESKENGDEAAEAADTDEQAKEMNDAGEAANTPHEREAKLPASPISRQSWVDHLQRDRRHEPYANLSNALVALRQAPELTDSLMFNEMAAATILHKPFPFIGSGAETTLQDWQPREVQDFDIGRLQEWLQAKIPTISLTTVYQAVNQRARERRFHPIRDYLDGVVWDHKQRLDTWFNYYLGAEHSDYSTAVGSMFLIGMVARIYQPGCQMDYMPFFEGGQGVKKSSFLRVLAGADEYFTDDLIDIKTKDARQHLRGRWLIELAELAAILKVEPELVKAFVSRRVEIYRPPFAKSEVMEARQCVFAGTTNADTYFADETGNRRFWPVRTERIDIDALARARDQLFAEAVYRYKNKQPWWPEEDFEKACIKPEQERRYIEDTWQGQIVDYLLGRRSVFVRQIACEAIGMEVKDCNTRSDRRIAAILKKAGWARGEHTKFGTPWVKADDG